MASMVPTTQRKVVLKSRPLGISQSAHFEIVAVDVPDLRAGEFLVIHLP